MNEDLSEAFRSGVFPITRRVSIGRYASESRVEYLLRAGYTHVVNFAESRSVCATDQGFKEVVDIPIEDLEPLPERTALHAVEALQRCLQEDESHRV